MGVFVRYGFRLTSMEMVGQEAGLTRQAVYHHFETKEALFRAVVESVNAGAHDAAVAAGLKHETGSGLAEVLAAQIAARWQYFADRVDESPHADELQSEHYRQSGDLIRLFTEKEYRLAVETIDRFLRRGTELRAGMTSEALARSVQIAERGAKADKTDADAFADLEFTIDLLVRGALASPCDATDSGNGRSA